MALGPNELSWVPDPTDVIGRSDMDRVGAIEGLIDSMLQSAIASDEGVITLVIHTYKLGIAGSGNLPRVMAEVVRRYQLAGWHGVNYELIHSGQGMNLRFNQKIEE